MGDTMCSPLAIEIDPWNDGCYVHTILLSFAMGQGRNA
jgi:hypothetical protein